jgi:hypothetical protein
VHPPPHHHPRTTTHPPPQEPPPPREPPPLRPCATPESSAILGRATPEEYTPIAAKRLLCRAHKNITYVK